MKAISNIADIAIRCPLPITKVTLINRARVVQPQGFVYRRRGILVVQLLEVRFEVLRAGHNHTGDLRLCHKHHQPCPLYHPLTSTLNLNLSST